MIFSSRIAKQRALVIAINRIRAVFKYDENRINHESSGSDYDDFKALFSDDERAFGFVRLQTGDELSKRVKFVLVTWMGPNVSAMKRAKMSTDKTQIKALIQNFAVEIQTNDLDELEYDYIVQELKKAGGANYGTGDRD
ncbi:Coactosin-like protein [Lamellibrachia satsuma]|nr:Coactosin-like protein [Lamellibrachia satsuma]